MVPKISVAMATYNGERYIERQLQSFLDQTLHPDELIVSDDRSTDGTISILRSFCDSAPFRVEVVQNVKNLGYCGNFSRALQRTRGDLVFLSDQDDVWFPEKIAHMVKVAQLNPKALIVMNDAALTDGELCEVGVTKLGQIRAAGLGVENFVMGCCCLIRRQLLDVCLPIPPGFKAHDSWLAWFADGLHSKVINGEVLQYYRRHGSNESSFIANRTRRISRIDEVLEAVRRSVWSQSWPRGEDQLKQLELFCEGVQSAMDRATDDFAYPLSELLDQARRNLSRQRARLDIRRRFIVGRFFAASQYLASGGYGSRGAFRSFLRDLIG